MTSETWRRDIPQWHNINTAAWATVRGPRITHGVEAKLVSAAADDADASATFMLRVPAGWSYAHPAEPGTLELFVLAGSVVAEGAPLPVGGFVAIPSGCGTVELTSPGGAELLVFFHPQFGTEHCYPDGELQRRSTLAEEWIPVQAPGLGHGVFFKPLRMPYLGGGEGFGGPAGVLMLLCSLPGFGTADAEHHGEVWEEMVMFAGDTLFPNNGIGGPGTVLNNPPWWEHGPFGTQRGHYLISQALAPIEIIRAHLPGGPQCLEHYFRTEPIYDAPARTDRWEDLELATVLHDEASTEAEADVAR